MKNLDFILDLWFSFEAHPDDSKPLYTYSVSGLVNEDYQAVLKCPYGRQWLHEFAHSPQKQLNISGKGIEIEAVFWHQDLEKWTQETLKKCP